MTVFRLKVIRSLCAHDLFYCVILALATTDGEDACDKCTGNEIRAAMIYLSMHGKPLLVIEERAVRKTDIPRRWNDGSCCGVQGRLFYCMAHVRHLFSP